MPAPIEYALYKGDEFIDIGTASALSKKLGITRRSVMFMATPVALHRQKGNGMIAVRLDPEEDPQKDQSHKGGNQMTPEVNKEQTHGERRLALYKLMEDNHIKGTALTAVTHINSGTLSQLRSGKMLISEKNWKILQEGIAKILDERTGVSEVKITKLEPVTEEAPLELLPTNKPLDIPEYMLQFLHEKGTALINKRFGGHDRHALEEYLRGKGFECTLSENRDHDWLAILVEAVEIKPVVEIQPECSDPLGLGEVIADPHGYAAKVDDESSSQPPVEQSLLIVEETPLTQNATVLLAPEITTENQIVVLEQIRNRNFMALVNADLLGEKIVRRIDEEQPVLTSIIEALKHPAHPKKDVDAHVEKTVAFLKNVEAIGLQLIEAVHAYVDPEKEPSDEPK